MTDSPSPPRVVEVPGVSHVFSAIDFPTLWRGREPMTAGEATTLVRLLGPMPLARTLEVGTGEGRLTPYLREMSREYVGTDAVPAFVRRVDLAPVPGRPARRIASNLYHLPFRDASFDSLAMVRVFNFLTEPTRALRELARVVAPGGSLVISYHPRPSLETLVDDVRRGMHGRRPGSPASVTFSRLGPPPALPSGIAAYPPSREEFAAAASAAGISLGGHWDLGLEDLRPTRWLPRRALRALSDLLTPCDILPVRFARLSMPGPARELPPLDDILACPRCREPPRDHAWGFDQGGRCTGCGFVLSRAESVTDARWSS